MLQKASRNSIIILHIHLNHNVQHEFSISNVSAKLYTWHTSEALEFLLYFNRSLD